jgi:hypothetical protein
MNLNVDVGLLFSWLTRNHMGPKYGSRPIGWYQIHQRHAIDVLQETFGKDADVCVRKGYVMFERAAALGCARIACTEVYRLADERCRKSIFQTHELITDVIIIEKENSK